MKKSLLASAIALSLGSASSAQALTISITSMNFFGANTAFGTMNDAGTGVMTTNTGFFGPNKWTADQQNWFDTHNAPLTWSGDGSNTPAAFTYNFTLTGNQVAAGTFFDWAGTLNIPVLTIYDCNAGVCLGNTLPMATVPFPGQTPAFNGVTNDTFPQSGVVPVPAAVWLMGSGLLGLVGVARRRKVA